MQVRTGGLQVAFRTTLKLKLPSRNLGYYPSWQPASTASILPDYRVAGRLPEPSRVVQLRRRLVGDGSCSAAALPVTVDCDGS
jgi:hypothetical protein